MKTSTYASVLAKASEYCGIPYSDLTNEHATQFRGFISTALRDIWEMFPWPETMAVEKFYFATVLDPNNLPSASSVEVGKCYYWPTDGNYYTVGYPYGSILIDENFMPTDTDGTAWTVDSNQTGFWYKAGDESGDEWNGTDSLDAGDIVTYTGDDTVRFRVNSFGLSGDDIATFDTYNVEVIPFVRDIDKLLTTDGGSRSTELGEICRITREDPRATSLLTPVNYYLIGDTIRIIDSVSYVWVEYRTVPPPLLTDPTTIPYRFSEYVAQKAASMFLLVNGKIDLGAVWAGLSESTMLRECDKVNSQEGQTKQIQVRVR